MDNVRRFDCDTDIRRTGANEYTPITHSSNKLQYNFIAIEFNANQAIIADRSTQVGDDFGSCPPPFMGEF